MARGPVRSDHPLLEARELKHHYPVRRGLFGGVSGYVRAVDGVSFTLHKGETFGLVGESGCGKTTVARMVVGLLRPTGGSLYLKGRDLARLSGRELFAARRQVQMVFQDPYASLDPRMRVGRILAEPLVVHRVGRPTEREARVQELLRLVGLQPQDGRRYPHEFSGGQRQRIAIARALALNPELLVCDEPVSSLDVSIRAQVLNLLCELQAEFGLTLFMISHDLSVVRHMCDRVAVMYLGQIVEAGAARSVFSAPAHPYTRALLDAVPIPDPRRASLGSPLTGELPSPVEPPSGCRFHPRCPVKMPRCAVEEPSIVQVTPGQFSACHLAAEARAGAGQAAVAT